MKSMIVPFSIRSETIANFGVTPTKGKICSCRSHFHPTASPASNLNSGLAITSRCTSQTTYCVQLWKTPPSSGDHEGFYRNRTTFKGCPVHM
jgi:hypothetical protein